MTGMRAEQIGKPYAFHGEGPVWWPADKSEVASTLRYVDMMAGRILTVRGDQVDSAEVPGPVAACIRPRTSGGIAAMTEHGVALADDAVGKDWRTLVQIITDPAVRFNDGGCDPLGNFYCGSMRYDQATDGAQLYRVTPSGEVTVALDKATVSNGLAWTAAGDRAYYNDTPTRATWVFDWDAAQGLQGRRKLFALDDNDQANGPDGLCVDAEGNVWTAIYGGSRVEARDRDGKLIEKIELPVTNVTACTFGDDDLATLYITTTRENVPAGEQPDAGAVYRVRPGVVGQAAAPFAG